ncbi:hypothetical protein [Parasitella parasitica]|uniref:Protein kinase domain-containing protein n=1 Tax=Parasitella parasitica TaxID=35722 RepID=A0A0B7MYX2_9FUNG|nr:hypothetical protein [Parasitella parasitica]
MYGYCSKSGHCCGFHPNGLNMASRCNQAEWAKCTYIAADCRGRRLSLSCPEEVVGITATKSKQNRTRLAFVSIVADATLEQLIPQVDQWTLQKTYHTALLVSSSVRDFHQQGRVHPNLQPRNIMVFRPNSASLIDDWPCFPLSSRYGRYPYIAPEVCHEHAHIDQQCNIYSLGIILWQLATGVIFPSSVLVSPTVYAIDEIKHMDPAYSMVVMRCLSPVRKTQQRPTADQVCDALTRILMAEMACPQSLVPHSTYIRERQTKLVKYLASAPNKQDLQNLLYGSSMSKRMMLQVVVSLERHHLYWHPASVASTTKKEHLRPPSAEEIDSFYPAKGHKKKYKWKRSYRVDHGKDDSACSNIYGVDLPDLMQIGYV